jgi:thiamine pyrophosphokinase
MAPHSGKGAIAVVVANGVVDPLTPVRDILATAGLVIAADGGANTLQQFGLRPHVVVGDMDSIEPHLLGEYERQGIGIVRYPARKDRTDLELSIEEAIQKGASEITLLGALGARLDMALSSVLLLTAPRFNEISLRIVDGRCEALLVTGPKKVPVNGRPGDILSLIPVGGAAAGITLENLAYPLRDETLPMGSTRGISNVLTAETAGIRLDRGQLLCILTHS